MSATDSSAYALPQATLAQQRVHAGTRPAPALALPVLSVLALRHLSVQQHQASRSHLSSTGLLTSTPAAEPKTTKELLFAYCVMCFAQAC